MSAEDLKRFNAQRTKGVSGLRTHGARDLMELVAITHRYRFHKRNCRACYHNLERIKELPP